MVKLVKHSKVSTIPDGDDSSLVRPSDWNADHDLTGIAESGANTDITSMSGITGGISTVDTIGFDTAYATALTAGQLGWDGNNTLGLGMAGGNVIQHIGEDTFFYVKASSAITKGQLCMFTGAVGSSGVLTAAPSNSIPFAEAIMGVAAEDIALNDFGLIQITGTLRGVNTSAFTEGNVLYYDSTVTGGFTNVYPTSGPIVIVAAVAKSGAGSSGVLTIRVSFQTKVEASTGISVSQTNNSATITNTAPDQVVSLTAGSNVTITGTYPSFTIASSGGAGGVTSFNTRTGAVTLSSADVTGALGYTPPNETNPVIFDALEFYGAGVTGYTPFANTMANWVVDTNDYSLFYLQNLNNGSDASADYVVYNDASDVDSYFIDMGINSSNYSSATYPIFTPNSSYVFSGGGTGAIVSDMFIGTSTANSDVVFFAGGVATTDEVMRIKANNNVIIGTDPDTGETFQVSGSAHIKGAAEFGSTVLLSTNPTTALQAATKEYVDNAVSSGLHIHAPVYAETSAALAAVYVQGGTTFNITDITGGNTVVTSAVHGLAVNDQIWLTTTAGNGLSINTPYFVYATLTTTSLQLSATYGGALLTGLTNATGISYATRANSGVGAYLESSANATFTIGSYTLTVGDRILVYQQATGYWDGVYTITSLGSGASKWKLTRATDQDKYSPQDVNGMGEGDYFLVTTNSESYVMTTAGALIIGYTPIVYTLFSSAPVYTGGTNINIAGGVISVSGTIAATLGGTGTSTVTTGDLLYGSGTNTWAKLPAGAGYKCLVMNAGGTQVEWNGVALNQANAVSGQLGISNGGTGQSTQTAAFDALSPATTKGDLIASNGTDNVRLAVGTDTQVLAADSTTATGLKWVAAGGFSGGTLTSQLKLAAGTATAGTAPLEFTSGTVNTTAEAGAMEYDGNTFYSSIAASTRGVMPSEQIVVLTSTNTLTSQTGVQPIFDGGGGAANGSVTLPVGTYQFECMYALTGMSATSGSYGFALGGAATKTYSWTSTAGKGTTLTANNISPSITFNTAANTSITPSNTGTGGIATIKGIIRVTVAGTVIPQVSLTQAAAAVVQTNSYFKVSPLGNVSTVAQVGNWS